MFWLGPHLEHHVARRHRHRHRRDGRCGDHHGRERAQGAGTFPRRARARPRSRASASDVIIEAAKSVGRPLFFSLLVITVSFIPVFSLTAQEGRLFKPLAFTKTFAMFFAALLGVTLVPVLMVLLIRGKITPESKESGQPLPDLGLSAVRQFRAALPLAHAARARLLVLGARPFIPYSQTRQGIHAAAQRRRHPLHADRRARHVDHRGDEDPANPGPHAARNCPRSSASSARPGSPKRRPIPRRCPCSRPSSRSSRQSNGGPA